MRSRSPTAPAKVRRVPNFRRHPQRREQMIDSALEVFFAKGYEAARIEDVARLAGVGKSAVLYHFGSKLALVASVVTKHCLPRDPIGAGPVETVVETSLGDPAAVKVMRFVLAEQHRLPSLGRLYVAAIMRRVRGWQDNASVETLRPLVGSAFGRIAARVLFEGYTTIGIAEDGQYRV